VRGKCSFKSKKIKCFKWPGGAMPKKEEWKVKKEIKKL